MSWSGTYTNETEATKNGVSRVLQIRARFIPWADSQGLGITIWVFEAATGLRELRLGSWCAGLFKLAGLLDSRFRQDFRSLSPPSPQRGRAFLGTQCAGQGFARRCFPFEVYSYIEFRFVSSLGIPGHWFQLNPTMPTTKDMNNAFRLEVAAVLANPQVPEAISPKFELSPTSTLNLESQVLKLESLALSLKPYPRLLRPETS